MLRTMGIPDLILQGDADYQVSDEDFRLWQEAAQDLTDVVFKRYPISITAICEDIAAWIKTGHLATTEG